MKSHRSVRLPAVFALAVSASIAGAQDDPHLDRTIETLASGRADE